jgi:transposase-like protein
MAWRGYPPEFRRRVVGLVEGGRKVAEVAADLGISEQTIYTWRRQARIDAGLLEERGVPQSAERAQETLVFALAAARSAAQGRGGLRGDRGQWVVSVIGVRRQTRCLITDQPEPLTLPAPERRRATHEIRTCRNPSPFTSGSRGA